MTALLKKFFEYSMGCLRESGFINNIYFSSNIMKRFFVKSDLTKVISIKIQSSINRKIYPSSGREKSLPVLSKIFENILTHLAKIIKDHSIFNNEVVCGFPNKKFTYFVAKSFACIILDNVLERISDHDRMHKKSNIVFTVGRILMISFPTKNIIFTLFESKIEGHVFRTYKHINSLLRKIWNSFIEMRWLDTSLFFRLQKIQKSVMV